MPNSIEEIIDAKDSFSYTSNIRGKDLINQPIRDLIKHGNIKADFQDFLKISFKNPFRRFQNRHITLNDFTKRFFMFYDSHDFISKINTVDLQYELCHLYPINQKLIDLRSSIYEIINDPSKFEAQPKKIIIETEHNYLEIISKELSTFGYKDNYEAINARNKHIEDLLNRSWDHACHYDQNWYTSRGKESKSRAINLIAALIGIIKKNLPINTRNLLGDTSIKIIASSSLVSLNNYSKAGILFRLNLILTELKAFLINYRNT